MIRLTILGTFELQSKEDGVIVLPTDKARALCTYLALEAPHPHRREKLAALLWPDIRHESALTNLRQTLYRLRLALEQEQPNATGALLTINRQTVQLHQQQWSVDAVTFARLLDEWERHSHDDLTNCEACLARLTQAVALYGGELLAGFGLPDAPAFEEWLLFQRQRLHHQFLRALTALAAAYEARGDDEIAQRHTERLLACDLYYEAHHRQMMRLLARRGRMSQALVHYETCRRLLRDDLGVAPDPETTALYHQIKAGEISKAPLVKPTLLTVDEGSVNATAARAPQQQAAMSKVISEKVKADHPLPSPPFVARTPELTLLNMGLTQMLAGHGQVRFVTGEAGSGKTALTRTFAQQVQLNQPDLVIGSSLCSAQTGIGDPYLPFRALLNQLTGTTETASSGGLSQHDATAGRLPLLATALLEHGADLLENFISGTALLARAESVSNGSSDWVTRLRTRVAQLQSTGTAMVQNRIFAEYTAVLQQVATQHPLLLIIDDLHWADASSLALLFHLLRNIERSRIFILATYRPEEIMHRDGDKAHPLALLVSEAKRSFGEVVIDLDQAIVRSGRRFVDALLDSEPNRLGERFRQAVFAHTQGQPLFTVELLRDLEARGELRRDASGRWMEPPSMNWTALPARVEGVIEARIGRLPRALCELLQAASVEGEDFTAEVVARVQGINEHEAVRLLGNELDRQHRLVSAQGITTNGAQPIAHYRFRHNLFQHYLYTSIDVAERAYLHAAVASALEVLYTGQREQVALPLAHHYQAAGHSEQAVDAYLLAGERAHTLSANIEATANFQQGLRLLATWPDAPQRQGRELALQLALGNALAVGRGYLAPETGTAFERAHTLCRQLGATEHLFAVLVGLERCYSARGKFDQAVALGEELVALAHQRHDPLISIAVHLTLGETLWYQGSFARSLAQMQQVIAHYNRQHHAQYLRRGSEDPGVNTMLVIASTLWFLGYPQQARQQIAEAVALAEDLGHPYMLMLAQYWNAIVHVWLREYETVHTHAAAVIRLCREHNFHYILGLGTIVDGWALAMQDGGAAGIEQMHQGLTLWGATGAHRSRHIMLALLAEGYSKVGQYTEGLRVVDEGLAAISRDGAILEAELYRIRGELLVQQAAPGMPAKSPMLAQAEVALRQALTVAQAQEAKGFELRASLSLSRLWQRQGKLAAAEQLLTEVYNWYSEGFDTVDLQEAQRLLTTLRASRTTAN